MFFLYWFVRISLAYGVSYVKSKYLVYETHYNLTHKILFHFQRLARTILLSKTKWTVVVSPLFLMALLRKYGFDLLQNVYN